MAGNAAEEGLMGQIGNPSHLDWGRIVVPAALLSGYAAGYLVWRLFYAVTFVGAVFVGLVVAGLVAWRLAKWFSVRDHARKEAEFHARRQAQEAEMKAAIDAMKKGDES